MGGGAERSSEKSPGHDQTGDTIAALMCSAHSISRAVGAWGVQFPCTGETGFALIMPRFLVSTFLLLLTLQFMSALACAQGRVGRWVGTASLLFGTLHAHGLVERVAKRAPHRAYNLAPEATEFVDFSCPLVFVLVEARPAETSRLHASGL